MSAQTITPSRHEKIEWARCAQALYWIPDQNARMIAHRMAGAASQPDGAAMDLARFDGIAHYYRQWLVFGAQSMLSEEAQS